MMGSAHVFRSSRRGPLSRVAAGLVLAAFLASHSLACVAACLLHGHRYEAMARSVSHHVMTCHEDQSVRAEPPPFILAMLPAAHPPTPAPLPVGLFKPMSLVLVLKHHVPSLDPPPPRMA